MDELKLKENYIDTARKDRWAVCVYGLGFLGQRLYNTVPDLFGLKAAYFCDGDDEKVDNARLPGLSGIRKSELMKTDVPVLVFVLADNPVDRIIADSLSANPNLNVVTIRDVIRMDEAIRSFYQDELYSRYTGLRDWRQERRR